METRKVRRRKLRELKLGEDYEPGRDYDFTLDVMRKLRVEREKSFDAQQKDHFKKTINKKQDIENVITEYEELKKADDGITYSILMNFFLFSFAVPYLLWFNENTIVTAVAAILSTLWGVKWALTGLIWEDGITLIKSKLQAYSEIIWDFYEDKRMSYERKLEENSKP